MIAEPEAMVRLEGEALRGTRSPVSFPQAEGQGEDKKQLAEATAG